jgi:DNA-binding beta-propeller fold protein YncE
MFALGTAAQAAPYTVLGSFDQNENPLAIAVDQPSETVYVGNVFGGVQRFDTSGTLLGSLEGCSGGFFGCWPAGLAVNPVDHNVYTYDRTNGVIDTLDPSTGAVVSSFPVTGGQQFVQIAADAAGNVFYPNEGENAVQKFTSAGTLLATFTGGGAVGAFSAPQGVAVDSSGDVYIADTGNGRVVRVAGTAGQPDPLGTQSVLDTGGSQDVAVDPGSGDVFAADLGGSGYHVVAYHADGTSFADFGEGTLGQGPSPDRVAVVSSTHHVYVTDAGSNQVWIFGPPPPTVATGEATGLQTTGATLNGTVNPNGVQLTDCHFDYGTSTAYGQTAACAPAAASVPPDSSDHEVTASVAGLAPNTTYHYRLVATSANGTANSQDQSFATADRPSIDSAYTQHATSTTVGIVAQINPHGADTSYRVEYGTTTSYGSTVPTPDAAMGSGFEGMTVTQQLGNLSPNVTYHWRILAGNSNGVTAGQDHTYFYSTRTSLPDGRAYELVSTAKEDGDVIGSPFTTSVHLGNGNRGLVSRDGNTIVWKNVFGGPFPYSSNGAEDTITATRGTAGWNQSTLTPAGNRGSAQTGLSAGSGDLSTVLLSMHRFNAPDSGPDLIESTSDGAYATIARGLPGYDAQLSADGSHAFFQTPATLAGDTHTTGKQLYEWTASGGLRVAAVDPAGQPTSSCGAVLAGSQSNLTYPSISPDGSRFLFESPEPNSPPNCGPSEVYVRERDSTTIEVSKPPASITDYGATFVGATSDLSKVFFVTQSRLTADKTNTDPDLYEYDVDTGALTRLSVGAPGYEDANVSPGEFAGGGLSDLSGSAVASADGSTVYFTALGQLQPGQGASSTVNHGRGTLNLYRWANGGASFIATIQPGQAPERELDAPQQTAALAGHEAAVTPDGSDLVFDSTSQLTAYDNAGQGELYRYDRPSGTISCVSCSPTGELPDGLVRPAFHAADPLSATAPLEQVGGLSADGSTVVFASSDKLLPGATNIALSFSQNVIYDIYEWRDGVLSLVSSGTSPSADILLGTSPSGSDIFFATAAQLAPSDGDHAYDIYDARVNGGFSATAVPVACRGTDTCRNPPSTTPDTAAAATVSFLGPGNPSPVAALIPASVRVLSRLVHGPTFVLTVDVPSSGRLTVTGADVQTVKSRIARAGEYRIRITLTPKARAVLHHKLELKPRLHVRFAPAGGRPSTATTFLTVKR